MTVLGGLVVSSIGAVSNNLAKQFAEPPAEAGIRCFWWWLNGNVTRAAITRDLEQMRAKGYGGALIFDANGSDQRGNSGVPAGPVFASPGWTDLFVHACQEAKRLGLELSLNIQSGWNLGGPSVTAAEASQHLVWSTMAVHGPAKVDTVLAMPAGDPAFYQDVVVLAVPVPASQARPAKPLEKLALKASAQELGMSAPDCRFLLEQAPPQAGEVVVRSQEIRQLPLAAGGKLQWDAPAGDWLVVRFGHRPTGARVSTQSAGWDGRVLDYLNPAALRSYWQRHIEPMCVAIGPLTGSTLRYIHTDSWEGGGMNWTPGLDGTFKAARGYDPLPWLAVMAGFIVDSRDESNAFLADFRKTIGELVANHYQVLSELAAAHGIGTHPECSGPHAGPLDGLKNYGRSSLVMSEFWAPSAHRPNPPDRFFVKQAASAAHTYGKRLVGAEGFTTIGTHWNDVPWSALKPSFDHEVCEGLNLLFNHTFTCSPEAMGVPGQEYFAGTHLNPQVTWWDEAPAIIRYFKRCQVVAQHGRFVADVLYYYGDHIPNIAGHKAADPAGALPGFDYDVLSEELLVRNLRVKDGRLVLPSGMTYRLLVLPDHRVLSYAALRWVDRLVRDGASVLGQKPLRTVSLQGGDHARAAFQALADGLWGTAPAPQGGRQVGKGRLAWGMTARQWLLENGVAEDVAFGGKTPAVGWIHYQIDGGDAYFLAEQAGKPVQLDVQFRGTGRLPELWNPMDGTMREAASFTFADGRTKLLLDLAAYESLWVVFRQSAAGGREGCSNTLVWQDPQTLGGPWAVTFDRKWGGPAAAVRFASLQSWTERAEAGIKYYSGKATYQTTFTLAAGARRGRVFAVELGAVKDLGIARVRLNGKDLGVVWFPPFRVALGDALGDGDNQLEVEVVNSWRNRLIGDQALAKGERLTQTNIRVDHWQLEPSGLLGPVRIVSRPEKLP